MDQDCLETTCNSAVSLDTSYRLTPSEIETMVKLRMTNRAYFSGKKNECMRGWRAILKHMGLHTKLNYYQAAKKWDNMRMRYKELKYPPEGAVLPPAWWGFKLMDNAMHGLLDSSAPIIALPPSDEDADFLPYKRRREHPRAPPRPPPLGGADASEIEVSLLDSGEEQQEEEEVELRRASWGMESERLALESERVSLEGERALMERERQLVAMETLGLQRERAGLEREEAGLGRQRAALERERTAVEREKALLARERAVLERERTELSRDRLAMERGRGRPARDGGVNGGVTGGVNGGMDGDVHGNSHGGWVEADGGVGEEGGDNGGGLDAGTLQRRERFLDLFEKLVENF
ncbi:uncharacterized protein LOC115531966 [Gadus morhua]|uniref:uncharacterized protein LOC115531966 n=1 Tax=Gadus morhua TaxID=8049 RepID=UPI0011B82DB0|nr:uncharacterized protein LOC115531966 [Gadus morhua]